VFVCSKDIGPGNHDHLAKGWAFSDLVAQARRFGVERSRE